MGHGHSHGNDDAPPLTEAERLGRRQAGRWMAAVLMPLAVLTFVALIALWPHDTASALRQDTGVARLDGTTLHVGTITSAEPTTCDGQQGSVPGAEQTCGHLVVRVDHGPEAGSTQRFTVTSAIWASGVTAGQKVTMYRVPVPQGPVLYSFVDFERTAPLWTFVVAFAVVVLLVARWRGLMSLVGLGFGCFILIQFLMPNLILGRDPLLVGLVAAAAIMFVVLFASHGFTLRTVTALIGTFFGLVLAMALSVVATNWGHLTGVTGEDDFSLAASAPQLQLTSVVVCGIVVASLGALNDVTITQASAVWELSRTERNPWRLYRSAMRIGRDHIASTVYTIAFAGIGGSLGILLLLNVYHQPLSEALRGEVFAEEILRTTIGSIGLVLAVPLTNLVGVLFATTAKREEDAVTSVNPEAALVPAGTPVPDVAARAADAGPVATRLVTGQVARTWQVERSEPASATNPDGAPRRAEHQDHTVYRRPGQEPDSNQTPE